MRQKCRLSRRLQRQYSEVLQGLASSWYYPHPMAWHGVPHGTPANHAWQAYLFAKEWGGRKGVDFKRLQRIVLRADNGECAYRFARDVKGANIKKLEATVIRSSDMDAIRKFSLLPGANRQKLENIVLVAQILES